MTTVEGQIREFIDSHPNKEEEIAAVCKIANE
jgi:hypothetical protein